jgi:hypothetical protein
MRVNETTRQCRRQATLIYWQPKGPGMLGSRWATDAAARQSIFRQVHRRRATSGKEGNVDPVLCVGVGES